jgi:cysteine desulfurase/selenocysteine lyase
MSSSFQHPSNNEKDFFSSIRQQFPQLQTSPSYTYLDSAATTLKPQRVIDALCHFYSKEYATINRSLYKAARNASDRYEETRTKVKQFLSASSEEEIIFTKGATDSINFLADLLARSTLTPKSKIILSHMEHHSNIVPWQMVSERTGAQIIPIPIKEQGSLDLDFLEKELKKGNVAIVSLCHVSNVLGTINPVRSIADLCHRFGAIFAIDAAQSAPHMLLDVQAMGCDFLSFSSHKMYGPTGVGVFWGKKELLEKLSPTRGGGGMIDTVTFEKTTYGMLPGRFEPGTPAIAEVIGLGEALSFLNEIGIARIAEWEISITKYLRKKLARLPEILFIGKASERGPLQSFTFKNAHPLDIATFLDMRNIAIRSGHMCCQPLLQSLNTTSLLRASIGVYNSFDDCDRLISALEEVLPLVTA